jgi:hypothetical protein
MNLLTVEERIQCLKNLLEDPNDWISSELLRLSDDDEFEPETPDGPIGVNDSNPVASKRR